MKKRAQKPMYFPNTNPMSTGEVAKELGVGINNEFLIKKLKLKPLLENRQTCYWDDIDLIKERLAEYFTKMARK